MKTAVHEIGHVLNIGEADDNGDDEVYSGGINDSDEENIKISGRSGEFWSIMSGGTSNQQYVSPTDDTFFAFSIQELFTISTTDNAVDEEDSN